MKNVSFMRNGKEFEPTKNELKIVLDDYVERLARSEAENKRLNYVVEKHKKQALKMAQQLAEKENEIDCKVNYIDELEIRNKELSKWQFTRKNETAIAELEMVKENIYKRLKNQKDNVYAQYDYQVFKPVIEFIDQQIKELRGDEK